MELAAGFEQLRLLTSRINRTTSEEQIALRTKHVEKCRELLRLVDEIKEFLLYSVSRGEEHLEGMIHPEPKEQRRQM